MFPTRVVEMYRNAADYDLEYREVVADIPWLGALCARFASGGKVLNLCCGTLREGIPLARTGVKHNFKIVGVDITPEMLKRGKEKLAAETEEVQARFQLVLGDIRDVAVGYGEFNFAFIPFNSLWHMPTQEDLLAALVNAHQHLVSGGHFIADVFHPDIHKLEAGMKDPAPVWGDRVVDDPNQDLRLARWATRQYFPAEQTIREVWYYSKYRLTDNQQLIDAYWLPMTLRIAFPGELQLALRYVGFEIVECWGDYDGNLFNNESPKMLFLCQKKQ